MNSSFRFCRLLGLIVLLLPIAAGPVLAEDKLPFAEPTDWRELPDTALVKTSQGDFEIEFFRKEAPISVRNFQYLVENHRYDGVAFHVYGEDFIIQGGDVTGTGKGGPGYTLPPEISAIKHAVGMIGWARLPNEVNAERRSNGSQFYISLNRNRHLDGMYTIFAKVIRGMNVVEQLRRDDKIITIVLPRSFRNRSPASVSERRGPQPSSSAVPTKAERELPLDGRTVDGDSFAIPSR